MSGLKSMWCVDVKRTTGQRIQYRLSLDLQHAINSDFKGRQVLIHALIIIPLAPYLLTKRRYHSVRNGQRTRNDSAAKPPFGVGKVMRLYRLPTSEAHHFPVTRSQFVGKDYWTVRPYVLVRNYLQHDYCWSSRLQITADLTCWQDRLYKARRPNWLIGTLTNYRIHRQLKRIEKKWVQKQYRFWKF